MRELVPNAPAIAVLINPMNVDAPGQLREVQAAARAARQELFVIVAGDPMFVSRREQIGSLGDIGYIDDVDPNAGEIATSFDGRSVTYVFGELDMLVPAYATTIHKSQGSEYPAVIIPMLTQHYAMLQRNLLCTGVTRGKRLVVLVGQKKAVAIAVRNVSGRRRWSKLSEWLRPRPPIACHVGTAG
jgi:ATP-dependent exoDNAse (exonuclease V) alpha subunit